MFRLPRPPFTMSVRPFAPVLACAALLSSCSGPQQEEHTVSLEEIQSHLESAAGEVAVVYRDLEGSRSFDNLPDLRMHAASTMKVPVMIQVFQDRSDGRWALDDSVQVRTGFSSIVDGSPYQLAAEDDSDTTLYDLAGQKVTYRHLTELMITLSSNLATNILIEEVGAERVTASITIKVVSIP